MRIDSLLPMSLLMPRLSYAIRRCIPTFVVVFCILLLIILILPAIQQSREAARRSTSKNNLKQIGLAFHNYHDTHSCFPIGGTFAEDGTPMHGWPLRIAPFMDASPLYHYFDQNYPWDDPENVWHSRTWILTYQSPKISLETTDGGFPLIHYSGNAQFFPDNHSVSMDQITVGTSNVWLCVETFDDWQPWATPFNTIDLTWPVRIHPDVDSYTGEGTHFLLADGSVVYGSGPELAQLADSVPHPDWQLEPAHESLRFETPEWDYLPILQPGYREYYQAEIWPHEIFIYDMEAMLDTSMTPEKLQQRLLQSLRDGLERSPEATTLQIREKVLDEETLSLVLQLDDLQYLFLERNELHNSKLKQLSKLESLKLLSLHVDETTAQFLRETLPDCELRLHVIETEVDDDNPAPDDTDQATSDL